MFEKFKRKMEVKRYAKKLPIALRKLFGRQEYYSKGQVDRAISSTYRKYRNKPINRTDVTYAYAMLCAPLEFNEIYGNSGQPDDYVNLRKEISEYCFGYTCDFSCSSLESVSGSGSYGDGGGAGDSGGSGDGGGC